MVHSIFSTKKLKSLAMKKISLIDGLLTLHIVTDLQSSNLPTQFQGISNSDLLAVFTDEPLVIQIDCVPRCIISYD